MENERGDQIGMGVEWSEMDLSEMGGTKKVNE